MHQSDAVFTVLVVCTANICRSPLAAALLGSRLTGTAGFEIASAGTHALVGEPIFETTRKLGEKYGIAAAQLAAHRARQLEQPEVEAADLVLAMTRDHRRQIVELSPRSTRRVFTLREFARLAQATDPAALSAPGGTTSERLRAAVRTITFSRGAAGPLADPSSIDVPDPYGQPEEAHISSAMLMDRAVDAVAKALLRAAAPPAESQGGS